MWKRNLYVSWMTQILSLTGFGFALPFLPFFIQELGVTDPGELRLWTGVLSSAPALSMGIMAPIWGIIADRFGKKMMILRAMLGGAVVIGLMSLAQSVEMVLALRIIQGAFTGTMAASATLIATGTPRIKLAWALGLLSSSNFIGISLGPLVGGFASEAFGYRTSFLIGSFVVLFGATLVILFVREQPIADDDSEGDVVVGRVGGSASAGDTATPRVPIRAQLVALLTAPVLTMLMTLLVIRFVKSLPIPFLPLHVQALRGQLEGSATATGILSAARGAVSALAAITLTRLGDRVPKLQFVAVLVGIGGLLSLPLAFLPGLWSFSILIVASTYFLGAIEPLIQADLSARTPANRRGLLFGVQTTAGTIGWFLAPLFGSAVSIGFDIPAVFLTLTIMLFATMALMLAMIRRQRAV